MARSGPLETSGLRKEYGGDANTRHRGWFSAVLARPTVEESAKLPSSLSSRSAVRDPRPELLSRRGTIAPVREKQVITVFVQPDIGDRLQ